MEHITVYSEDQIYAGWPANHGMWQWGNHILVGFMRGEYKESNFAIHRIGRPYEFMQARTLDGGYTWKIESTGITDIFVENNFLDPELLQPDEIIRARGSFDHGGDSVPRQGGYWKSSDFGLHWHGPFEFVGWENWLKDDESVTTRTEKRGNFIACSKAKTYNWGTDESFMLYYNRETMKFEHWSDICIDHHRAVMPSLAFDNDNLITYAALRRRGAHMGCWIDLYTTDNFMDWHYVSKIADAPGDNGNPPALVMGNGSLYCAYGNRSEESIMCAKSTDQGITWKHFPIREGGTVDIGYPQLTIREDGKLVCVYYWAEEDNDLPQRIECSIFDG